MTSVDDLMAFLRARYDDEERLAAKLAERYRVRNPDLPTHGQPFWPLPSVEARFTAASDPDIAAGLDLIKTYSPARALAEVEAKRRILDLHTPRPEGDCDACNERQYGNPCPTVRALALPHAEHPDYLPEWRP